MTTATATLADWDTHFEMLAVLIFKFAAPYACSSFACAWNMKTTDYFFKHYNGEKKKNQQ